MNQPLRLLAMVSFPLLLASACTSPSTDRELSAPDIESDSLPMRALGQEPPWLLELQAEQMRLTLDYGSTRISSDVPETSVDGSQVRYQADSEAGRIRAEISPGLCVDTMSGMTYPYRVRVWLAEQALSGCGGDPEQLLTAHAWQPVTLAGTPVDGDRTVQFSFDGAGQFAGQGPCNRFGGRYQLTGESLRLDGIYSTRMACPEPLMAQEQALLEALERTHGFRMPDSGELVLVSTEGETLETRAVMD